MQTFLPYPGFEESARCLDNRRLGKQRVEVLQILKALQTGPVQFSIEHLDKFKYKNGLHQRKTPWYSHPATKMWKGYECILMNYGVWICWEWKKRGFKDTCEDKIYYLSKSFPIKNETPPWLHNEKFHLSHKSNLIRKNPLHYRPIFGNDIPDNLPYVWPV